MDTLPFVPLAAAGTLTASEFWTPGCDASMSHGARLSAIVAATGVAFGFWMVIVPRSP